MEGRAVPKERERLTNFQLQFKNGTGGEFLLSDSMTPHPNSPRRFFASPGQRAKHGVARLRRLVGWC